jgi:hypothetical protein
LAFVICACLFFTMFLRLLVVAFVDMLIVSVMLHGKAIADPHSMRGTAAVLTEQRFVRNLQEYPWAGNEKDANGPYIAATATNSLQNYPLTFTTGFARQDYVDLAANNWVQASVTSLGACAPYDPSVAILFQPKSPSGIKSFKAVALVFNSAQSADLIFIYFTNSNCAGSGASTKFVTTPVTQTVTAANGVKLTATLSYVQQPQEAIRLLPPSSSGFVISYVIILL